ncbi:MAG: dioxygenase, partial [Alphaproteobacteria bacterium]|nr:dioxygenase [Alphaproteobacteria bacterium]
GSPDLADQVVRRLEGASKRLDWGLDHGTWSVLKWMYPKADIPVVQLSIDRRLAPARHVELGRALAPLRDEGVLVLASGNIVHNLRDAFGRMRVRNTDTPAWAASFDRDVATALEQHDADGLVGLASREDGRLSHPTPDHWLPLLYAAGAASDGPVRFENAGFDLGSLSMRSVVLG